MGSRWLIGPSSLHETVYFDDKATPVNSLELLLASEVVNSMFGTVQYLDGHAIIVQ